MGDPSQVNQELVLGWLIAASLRGARWPPSAGKGVSPQDAESFFTRAKFTNAQGGTTPSEASVQAVQTAYALSLLTGQDSSTPRPPSRPPTRCSRTSRPPTSTVNPRYGTFDYKWATRPRASR